MPRRYPSQPQTRKTEIDKRALRCRVTAHLRRSYSIRPRAYCPVRVSKLRYTLSLRAFLVLYRLPIHEGPAMNTTIGTSFLGPCPPPSDSGASSFATHLEALVPTMKTLPPLAEARRCHHSARPAGSVWRSERAYPRSVPRRGSSLLSARKNRSGRDSTSIQHQSLPPQHAPATSWTPLNCCLTFLPSNTSWAAVFVLP